MPAQCGRKEAGTSDPKRRLSLRIVPPTTADRHGRTRRGIDVPTAGLTDAWKSSPCARGARWWPGTLRDLFRLPEHVPARSVCALSAPDPNGSTAPGQLLPALCTPRGSTTCSRGRVRTGAATHHDAPSPPDQAAPTVVTCTATVRSEHGDFLERSAHCAWSPSPTHHQRMPRSPSTGPPRCTTRCPTASRPRYTKRTPGRAVWLARFSRQVRISPSRPAAEAGLPLYCGQEHEADVDARPPRGGDPARLLRDNDDVAAGTWTRQYNDPATGTGGGCLICPYGWDEPFGMVISRRMAVGTPSWPQAEARPELVATGAHRLGARPASRTFRRRCKPGHADRYRPTNNASAHVSQLSSPLMAAPYERST